MWILNGQSLDFGLDSKNWILQLNFLSIKNPITDFLDQIVIFAIFALFWSENNFLSFIASLKMRKFLSDLTSFLELTFTR